MKLYKHDGAGSPAFFYYPATAGETITAGEALVLTAGALTKCGDAAVPQFIAQSSGADGDQIAVIQVVPGDLYLAEFSVAATAVALGNALKLDATGTKVTATTGGKAIVREIFGTAAGDSCAVSF